MKYFQNHSIVATQASCAFFSWSSICGAVPVVRVSSSAYTTAFVFESSVWLEGCGP